MSDPGARAIIMVVEDEALIRMQGVDMLEAAGFDVVEASNADEALSLLNNVPDVQLMFSDVDMPGSMNGVALAEVVHGRWPNIRLLITSGHRHFADSQLPDDGRFVPKPYTRDVVVGQVQDLLKK